VNYPVTKAQYLKSSGNFWAARHTATIHCYNFRKQILYAKMDIDTTHYKFIFNNNADIKKRFELKSCWRVSHESTLQERK
jgi:glyoxylate carboligase